MKRVIVFGAAPTGAQVIEPVEIVICGNFPDHEFGGLEDLGRGFEKDAKALFDALARTLPRGTLVRLTGLLLNKEAQDCYLVVPAETKGEPQ